MFRSMLGALVGDAAGAVLEGERTVTSEKVERALTMPGGGFLRVGPGQITDDGELTLTLWQALQGHSPADGFPVSSVLTAYAAWYDSCPFDIGQTCSLAFQAVEQFLLKNPVYGQLERNELLLQIQRLNRSSQANGALMRATALATWVAPCAEVSAEQAAEYAMEDARWSHPHSICQDTNAIYVYALVHLLRGVSPSQVLEYTNGFVILNDFSPEVKHWFFNESQNIGDLNCTTQIGHVRWGFVMAFYFLRNPSILYEEALRTALLHGGDTDTNACIVGGLVGAYQPIPHTLLNPVLEFDCMTQGNRRPVTYSVKAVIGAK